MKTENRDVVLEVAAGKMAGQLDWGFGLSAAVRSVVRRFYRVGSSGREVKGTYREWLEFFTPLSASWDRVAM
jgi:hypothetical protein